MPASSGTHAPTRARNAILFVADARRDANPVRRWLDQQHFLPGGRLKNYLELATGFGVPHSVEDVRRLGPESLLGPDGLRYTSVVFTCPLRRLSATQWSLLETTATQQGLSLIADAFLLSEPRHRALFGVTRCRGLRISLQRILDDSGRSLYEVRRRPFSSKGTDLGLRPVLRLLQQSWISRRLSASDETRVAARFKDESPAVVTHLVGRATHTCFNFHPGLVLHAASPMHRYVRDAITRSQVCPPVNIDLEGSVCLRMDDPGGCERVYLEGYDDGVLSAETWAEIERLLAKENAHLDVAYVPQWVDDGDPARGDLTCDGAPATDRRPGSTRASRGVVYTRKAPPRTYDYVAQYEAMRKGLAAGHLSVQSHGLTHLTVDTHAWARAPDRYTRKEWFREFREMVSRRPVAPEEIDRRLRQSAKDIQRDFGVTPRIVIPSAHEYAGPTPRLAYEAGFRILSARETVLLRKHGALVNRKVGSFYEVDSAAAMALLQAGYPIVDVFHDYDVYRGGVAWFRQRIAFLREHGARRFLRMNDWGAMLLARLDAVREGDQLLITMDLSEAPAGEDLPREIPLRISAPVGTGRTATGDPIEPDECRAGVTYVRLPVAAPGQLTRATFPLLPGAAP